MTLIINPIQEQAIRQHGRHTYPNECCGVLLGHIVNSDHAIVIDILPIDNAREQDEQYHRFVITAEDLFKAERQAQRQGLDVVGFYHSHPDHPAIPSEYDREHALPFYSYVIVAVAKGQDEALTSWRLSLDRQQFIQEIISPSPTEA